MSRPDQPIDKVSGCQSLGKGGVGVTDNGLEISFWLNENVLKLHGGDNTKTVWINLCIVHSKWTPYMVCKLWFKAVIKKLKIIAKLQCKYNHLSNYIRCE